MGKRAWWVFLLCLFVAASAVDAAAGELVKGLRRDVKESRELLAKASARLQAGESTHAEIAGLKAAAEKIRASRLLMEERFKARAEKAVLLGGKAAQRQETVAAEFGKALEEFLARIDAIPPDGTVSSATLEELKALLNRLVTPRKRPLLGTLPYKHLGYPAREPATSPIVVPAYKGGDRSVFPADTAASAEAPISAEITALAQSLQWNPVLIYEWVKNNVETEWYFGVMKGAEETLRQKSGNDADQAALLVSLLRASGFPSRFVKGTIEFFPGIDKLKNLTGIDDLLKIAAFFQKAGIPFKPVIAGGTIANFQVEHVWVESQIPYSNYRGAVIDDMGKSWLGLDTSIKPHGLAWNQPPEIPGFPLEGLRDDYLQAVRSSTLLEFVKAKAEEYLALNSPGKSWQDLLQSKTIIPDILNIIPASLQFKQIAITGEYTELPVELKHKLIVSATDNGSELFSITLETHNLSNRKLALRAEPETVEDQNIIDSFGGLDNTPSYLVRLRPVLILDGERLIVARDGLPMGADFTLTIDIVTPGGTERISSSQVNGNLAVIGVVGQKAQTPAAITESDDAEAILHKQAIGYIDRWNRAEDELAALMGQSISRPAVSIATVGGQIYVTYLLDTPHDFQWQGLFLDAGYRRIETVGVNGLEKEFMRLSSLQGSVLEHRIFEDDLKVDSVSTAKLLQLAGAGAAELVSIDKTNIDSILPTLPFDAAVKQDIADVVNQNLTVTIPQTEIDYQDWRGIGYLKENPVTGEAGWMLSGGIAGGMTTWLPERWNTVEDRAMSAALRAPYSGTPNRKPLEAASIIKIPATDLQDGTVGKPLNNKLQVKVLDAAFRPVETARVTFKVMAGDGKLEGNLTEMTVTTDSIGIAEVSLTLGEQTSTNPIYWLAEGKTVVDQYGGNIVDARLDNGTAITTPFTAFGKPASPDHLRKTHGDGVKGLIHSFAGFVGLVLEDRYGNPIANQSVTFTIGAPTGAPTCNKDTTPGALVKADDPCISSSPTTADLPACVTAAASLPETTTPSGAAAEVILGGAPNAVYKVTASTTAKNSAGMSLEPVYFSFGTLPFGNCTSDGPPTATLLTTYVLPTDAAGRNIDAGRSGSIITLKAREYLVREGERREEQTLTCSGTTLTCPQIFGSHAYTPITAFEASSIMFNGAPGIAKGGGVFELPYILSPGLNTVRIDGQVVYKQSAHANSCSGCRIDEKLETLTATAWLKVYGVDINIVQPLKIMLDSGNRSRNNLRIPYTIAPADYTAYSANILLYEITKTDGKDVENLIDYIPTENWWKGYGVLAKGYPFDPVKEYAVQVVLNYGSGVEVRSDKVTITFSLGALVPDYNHNRKIESDDLDRALNNDTYYFWINDDDGSGDTEGTGIPGSGSPPTVKMSGTRDVVDWFPVHLDIIRLLNKYDPSQYTYALKHTAERLRFVYTDLTPGKSGDYLTDVPTAQALVSTAAINDVTNLSGLTSRTSLTFNRLDAAFLQKIRAEGKGIVLLEGVEKANAPLELEVYGSGGNKVFTTSLKISLDGVEQMFRHKNLVEEGGGPAVSPIYDLTEHDRLSVPSNLPDEETNGKNFVFVHGYNVNPQKARGTHAEVFKRLYWSGSKSKFWGVTWHGYHTQIGTFTPDYHVNVIHAFETAPYLRIFLNTVVRGEVSIAAHSLGNMVVSSMLSDNAAGWDNNYRATFPIAKIKNYFMIDAAVAIEAYDSGVSQSDDMQHSDWINYKKELWASEWHKLFKSDVPMDHRANLTWRGRFDTRPKFTDYYNFYSSGEEVLATLSINTPLTQILIEEANQLGIYAWALQEKLKGANPITVDIVGNSLAGWGFNLEDYAEKDPYGRNTDNPIPFIFANSIPDPDLKTKPFFKKGFDSELYATGATGSSYAANNLNRLLGSAIPALTLPAGANKLNTIDPDKSFNMELKFKNDNGDWPQIRGDKTNWRHSDLKNVAYTFVYKMFHNLVILGGLDR